MFPLGGGGCISSDNGDRLRVPRADRKRQSCKSASGGESDCSSSSSGGSSISSVDDGSCGHFNGAEDGRNADNGCSDCHNCKHDSEAPISCRFTLSSEEEDDDEVERTSLGSRRDGGRLSSGDASVTSAPGSCAPGGGIYTRNQKFSSATRRTPSYKAANHSRPLTRSQSAAGTSSGDKNTLASVAGVEEVPAHANFLRYSHVVSSWGRGKSPGGRSPSRSLSSA